MSIPLDENGLRCDPRPVRKSLARNSTNFDWWWYEEKGGIQVMHDRGGVSGCFIPVAQLRAYLKRHDGR